MNPAPPKEEAPKAPAQITQLARSIDTKLGRIQDKVLLRAAYKGKRPNDGFEDE